MKTLSYGMPAIYEKNNGYNWLSFQLSMFNWTFKNSYKSYIEADVLINTGVFCLLNLCSKKYF